MADTNVGKVTQIVGAVIDAKFTEGKLPEIHDAITIATKSGDTLYAEVSQHLGDDTVRCIAMGPTDGLVRGMEAVGTGAPITVPVGEATLGRMFNVLGQPIDNKPAPKVDTYLPIHRKAPEFQSSQPRQRFWKPVLRSLTCFALIRRVVRSVCSVVPVLVRQY